MIWTWDLSGVLAHLEYPDGVDAPALGPGDTEVHTVGPGEQQQRLRFTEPPSRAARDDYASRPTPEPAMAGEAAVAVPLAVPEHGSMDRAAELKALAEVQARLQERFPELHADVVAAVVRLAHSNLDGPVRDFVPVLVEHAARDHLAFAASVGDGVLGDIRAPSPGTDG